MSNSNLLEVLLTTMRQKWVENDVDGALAPAKVAAPFLHLKVPASRLVEDLSGVSDDELDRVERRLGARSEDETPGEFA